MAEFSCPLDGCDYSASKVPSVEAHVSGCSDDLHKGEVGRQHREAIEALGDESIDESIEVEELGELEDDDDQEVEISEDEKVDLSAAGPAAGAAAVGGTSMLASGVEKDTLLKAGAGLMVLLLLYVLWKRMQSDGSGQQQSEQRSQNEQSQDEFVADEFEAVMS